MDQWDCILRALISRPKGHKAPAAGHNDIKAIHISTHNTLNTGRHGIVIMNLGRKDLEKFLRLHAGALPDGVLQKRVGITGEVESVFLAHWRPEFFSCQKIKLSKNSSSNMQLASSNLTISLPKEDVPPILQASEYI